MAAKKENTKKKDAGKKVETKKKPATKKVTKVTEEQLPKIAEELQEQAVIETVDLEKFKDEKGEYDLTKATETEVKSAINQLKGDDEIIVTKTEVMNGDPAVLTNSDEVKNETPIKKITKKINQYFGYIWNGQAIDY